MYIKIKRNAFLEAIEKLVAKKPLGRGKKAYLNGNISISLADKTIIFQADTAKVTGDASGSWEGAVYLPFQIAISLLKIPPKEEEMTIEYLDGKLKIGPLKLAATHYV